MSAGPAPPLGSGAAPGDSRGDVGPEGRADRWRTRVTLPRPRAGSPLRSPLGGGRLRPWQWGGGAAARGQRSSDPVRCGAASRRAQRRAAGRPRPLRVPLPSAWPLPSVPADPRAPCAFCSPLPASVPSVLTHPHHPSPARPHPPPPPPVPPCRCRSPRPSRPLPSRSAPLRPAPLTASRSRSPDVRFAANRGRRSVSEVEREDDVSACCSAVGVPGGRGRR